MDAKFFRVAGLSSVPHTDETRAIFKRNVNGSITEFVTEAICQYAESLGFQHPTSCKPEYLNSVQFQKIQDMIRRSRKADYTYLYAFEFLRSRHPGAGSASVQRLAITNFSQSP